MSRVIGQCNTADFKGRVLGQCNAILLKSAVYYPVRNMLGK